MAEERLQRRLAAVLSADVVGYSRLMALDEAGTLSRLSALRRELIDPTIAAHSGRIFKLMGDGALVEFASAVDAVSCAIEIQRQLRAHGAARTGLIRYNSGLASTLAMSSSPARIFLATASMWRRGSKALPNPVASRFPRTSGSRCGGKLRRRRRTELKEHSPAGSRLSGRSRNRKSHAVEGRYSVLAGDTLDTWLAEAIRLSPSAQRLLLGTSN